MNTQMIDSKVLAIIQDFTALWAIKIEQMANIWKFYNYSKSWEGIHTITAFLPMICSNISKWAIFSKYHQSLVFNLSVSCKILDRSKWNRISDFDQKIKYLKIFLLKFVSRISINSQNIHFIQQNIRTVFQDT